MDGAYMSVTWEAWSRTKCSCTFETFPSTVFGTRLNSKGYSGKKVIRRKLKIAFTFLKLLSDFLSKENISSLSGSFKCNSTRASQGEHFSSLFCLEKCFIRLPRSLMKTHSSFPR